MGCDGGTIPRRDELVKTKKKPEEKDKDAERLYRWKHCSISQSKLQEPIVSCELGRMYNKEEVISRLLSKLNIPAMSHIRGLKDLKELRLTRNSSYRENISKGDEYIDFQKAEYICPVTSQEMNGKSHFFFIWTCGCVLSERALKEIKSDKCLICNQQFIQTDVIPLNPSNDETVSLNVRMMERRAKLKANRKGKKREVEDGAKEETKKKKTNGEPSTSKNSQGKSTPSVSAYASDILRSKEFKNVRSETFSVAGDASKSEVFKSIFDSHDSAKHKPTSHWVTCNPQYF